MAISISKFAPSAAVVAFFGYCLWPTVSEMYCPTKPAKPAAEKEKLASSLFSPASYPLPTRNPWGGKDKAALLAAQKAAENGTSGQNAAQTAKASQPPADPLTGLTLDATSLTGRRRLAVINNTLYALNDILPDAAPAAPPRKIVGVSPYEVLVLYRGKTFTLKYSDPMSDASATKNKSHASSAGAKSGGEKKSGKAGR